MVLGSTALSLAIPLLGCAAKPSATEPLPRADTAALEEPFLRDATATSGLDFHHENGATGAFYYPELMQGGGALLDYDGDGDLDLYVVQSGPLPARSGDPGHDNVLFRNLGGLRFERATNTGSEDPHYGSGAAAADFDDDGDIDLYVTNLGPNTLLQNRGDGSFDDVTARFGVGDSSYSTSATWFDMDQDGDLDLYVANYVAWAPELEQRCLGYNGLAGYCGPHEYQPQADTLYRNDGASFTDVSTSSGIRAVSSTGLGVVAADFDGDGDTDLYVANDQRANNLWTNDGTGHFVDDALLLGAAFNERGLPEAGMGVLAEDFDLDSDIDLFMTHLSGETNTFYRNDRTSFRDVTDDLGLGAVSQPYTGFGVVLADFDLDGERDLFLANGKVSPGDTVEFEYAEPNQLLRGQPDGRFADASATAGDALALLEVSRATPAGDLDGDGDVDIAIVNNQGPLRLFESTAAPSDIAWLSVDLQAGEFGPLGMLAGRNAGARISVRSPGASLSDAPIAHDLYQAGSGYASSNDPRAHFGLGTIAPGASVDVSVDLPEGRRVRVLDVPTNHTVRFSTRRWAVVSSAATGR